MTKDFLVLTSNTGGKDTLRDPDTVYDSCDYVAFVDTPGPLKTWKQIKPYNFSCIDTYTHRRNAKVYKVLSTLFFPQYKYIIWHDACFQLTIDPIEIIRKYGENDLYLTSHPLRDCAYDEMRVIRGVVDDVKPVLDQEVYYKSKNFPPHYGLYSMGTFLRKVSPAVTTLELKWWEHICKYSSRDQCSFTHCLWDTEVNSDMHIQRITLNGTWINNQYFALVSQHLK